MLGQCCDRLAMTIHLWQYLTALHWQCWLRFLLHLSLSQVTHPQEARASATDQQSASVWKGDRLHPSIVPPVPASLY